MEHAPGQHLLLDLYGAHHLTDVEAIQTVLESAARVCQATILKSVFHTFGDGGGVTGVVVLMESHISIHTWPESGYAAIDVFMCGACDPLKAIDVCRQAFQPEHIEQQLIRRGSQAVSIPASEV